MPPVASVTAKSESSVLSFGVRELGVRISRFGSLRRRAHQGIDWKWARVSLVDIGPGIENGMDGTIFGKGSLKSNSAWKCLQHAAG